MQFRTDLALESALSIPDKTDGFSQSCEEYGSIKFYTVDVTTPQAAKELGKSQGRYITAEIPPLSDNAEQSDSDILETAKKLRKLLPADGTVLVAGLGNTQITPDALGPQTAEGVLATRHITGELARSCGMENLRGTAVISPGVMGQTGIETEEIISAVVNSISPCAVIAVDALAARSTARLGCTVQLCNSGIAPGAGVHNARRALCKETLGIPVIAVGIPTVVDAASLASDLLYGKNDADPNVKALFEPRGAKMIVTPREIDLIIERGSRFLAAVINCALQPELSLDEIKYLMA